MLVEARMIKDLRPQFNKSLKDDKTFPYLQIRTREEFPRVEFTRSPRRKGVRLYGPFTHTTSLRAAVNVLQRIFQFRTCTLDIKSDGQRAGSGSARACCTAFATAPPRATSASAATNTAGR